MQTKPKFSDNAAKVAHMGQSQQSYLSANLLKLDKAINDNDQNEKWLAQELHENIEYDSQQSHDMAFNTGQDQDKVTDPICCASVWSQMGYIKWADSAMSKLSDLLCNLILPLRWGTREIQCGISRWEFLRWMSTASETASRTSGSISLLLLLSSVSKVFHALFIYTLFSETIE